MSTQVEAWQSEELDAAMAFVGTKGGSQASPPGAAATQATSSTSASAGSDEYKKAQAIVTKTVERSLRVYGILFASLPTELRAQTAHIPRGFAYGLWQWLETKFQSTEEDHIGDLLETWSTLRQETGESYDAYRARVNELRALLQAANEAPSARMYAHTVLGRLLPVYKQAVLALKVGDKLKDATKIDWDAAAAFINAHERDQLRTGSSEIDASAMAATERRPTSHFPGKSMHVSPGSMPTSSSETTSSSRTPDTRRCFNCDKVGHISRRCKAPRKQQSPSADGHQPQAGAQAASAKGHLAASGGARTADQSAHSAVARAGSHDGSHANVEQTQLGKMSTSSLPRSAHASMRHTAYVVTASRSYAAVVSGATAPQELRLQAARPTTSPVPVPSGPASNTAKLHLKLQEKTAPQTSPTAEPKSDERTSDIVAAPSTSKMKSVAAAVAHVAATEADDSAVPVCTAPWGVDSMASIHLSGNKKLFTHLRSCPPISVEVADRSVVTTQVCGSVKIRITTAAGKSMVIPIENVYYHERFAANLLSLGLLTQDGWSYRAEKTQTTLTTPGGNRIQLSTR
ncbi:MAG: hypothetical protein P4L40_21480, partial [Terracidiphilus sp.]|nr:hypothetical protein [Terracidiphilus sp.]